jgi:hypothetical protein
MILLWVVRRPSGYARAVSSYGTVRVTDAHSCLTAVDSRHAVTAVVKMQPTHKIKENIPTIHDPRYGMQ